MTSFIFFKLNIVGFDFLVFFLFFIFLSISLFYFEANKFENLTTSFNIRVNKEDICLYECM